MNKDYHFRVYYEDTDAGGVVYHARYLAFAERARSEGLREGGMGPAEIIKAFGVGFIVSNLSIKFIKPLQLDDAGVVETNVISYGKASVKLEQIVWKLDGETEEKTKSAVLVVDLVAVDEKKFRPVRIPAECVKMMEKSWGRAGESLQEG